MAITRNTPAAVGRSWQRTYSGRRRAAPPDVRWLIFSGLSVLGLPALYLFADESGHLIAAAVGGCLVCLASFIAVGRLLPGYYAMRLLIVSYALQLLALIAIALLGLPLSPTYHPFEANAADAPFTIVLAMLAAPAGALVVALAWWFVSPSSQLAEKISSQEDIAKQRRVYLVIAAFVQLLFWPAALENSGVAGYLVRIAAAALTVAPFLAGRDSQGDRGLARLWCLTLLVNGVVGIVVGGTIESPSCCRALYGRIHLRAAAKSAACCSCMRGDRDRAAHSIRRGRGRCQRPAWPRRVGTGDGRSHTGRSP